MSTRYDLNDVVHVREEYAGTDAHTKDQYKVLGVTRRSGEIIYELRCTTTLTTGAQTLFLREHEVTADH